MSIVVSVKLVQIYPVNTRPQKKILSTNNNLYMTKTQRKGIMLRTRLKTKYNKKQVNLKLG